MVWLLVAQHGTLHAILAVIGWPWVPEDCSPDDLERTSSLKQQGATVQQRLLVTVSLQQIA